MEGSVLSVLKAEWKVSDTDTQPTEPLVVLFVNREFKMATIAKQIVVNSNPVHGEVY